MRSVCGHGKVYGLQVGCDGEYCKDIAILEEIISGGRSFLLGESKECKVCWR